MNQEAWFFDNKKNKDKGDAFDSELFSEQMIDEAQIDYIPNELRFNDQFKNKTIK